MEIVKFSINGETGIREVVIDLKRIKELKDDKIYSNHIKNNNEHLNDVLIWTIKKLGDEHIYCSDCKIHGITTLVGDTIDDAIHHLIKHSKDGKSKVSPISLDRLVWRYMLELYFPFLVRFREFGIQI